MKTILSAALLLIVFVTGCAGPLAISELDVEPKAVAVGATALITVQFTGPKNSVASVEATVREAPDIYYVLVDDGTMGDEKANDNIWTVGAEVPYEAAPGIYHLDIRAKDLDGNTILIKGGELTNMGYSGSVTVTVN